MQIYRFKGFEALLGLCCIATGCSESNSPQAFATTSQSSSSPSLQKKLQDAISRCQEAETQMVFITAEYNATIIAYGLKLPRKPDFDARCADALDATVSSPSTPIHKRNDAIKRVDQPINSPSQQTPKPIALCWESYCPCKAPQGGPDQLLCDQIRVGKADPQMLSVGKSMREARRQMAADPF